MNLNEFYEFYQKRAGTFSRSDKKKSSLLRMFRNCALALLIMPVGVFLDSLLTPFLPEWFRATFFMLGIFPLSVFLLFYSWYAFNIYNPRRRLFFLGRLYAICRVLVEDADITIEDNSKVSKALFYRPEFGDVCIRYRIDLLASQPKMLPGGVPASAIPDVKSYWQLNFKTSLTNLKCYFNARDLSEPEITLVQAKENIDENKQKNFEKSLSSLLKDTPLRGYFEVKDGMVILNIDDALKRFNRSGNPYFRRGDNGKNCITDNIYALEGAEELIIALASYTAA